MKRTDLARAPLKALFSVFSTFNLNLYFNLTFQHKGITIFSRDRRSQIADRVSLPKSECDLNLNKTIVTLIHDTPKNTL